MERKIIHAKEGCEFLEEFMTELPVNCLFDKGKTGCGGTTLAINTDKNTIIAMPYVNLVKNKVQQPEKHRHELLGVDGDTTINEILEYIDNHKIKKIAVVYNSLERLIKILIEKNIDVYKDYFLLVDEWHILFNSYCFRNDAVKKILHHGQHFKKVTYMTATPVEDEFILKEIRGLPIVEIKWKNTMPVDITPEPVNSTISRVCELIEIVRNKKVKDNLHFFVNSVHFIAGVIKKLDLKSDEVKIVCSNQQDNKSKLGGFKIETPLDSAKKINFYTSTSFEGCDIYDKKGRIFIVSDNRLRHTLLDVSTLIIQICGRIRDSQYITDIHHIFTETRYSNFISLSEYKASSLKNLTLSQNIVNRINEAPENERSAIIGMIEKEGRGGMNERYMYRVDNRLEIDDNLIMVDIQNFKITNHLYQGRVSLQTEYQKYGFTVLPEMRKNYSDRLVVNSKAKILFKDLFIEYEKIRKEQPIHFCFGDTEDRRSLIEKARPLVKESYEILGVDKVRELKYNVTNIKRELYKIDFDVSQDVKIIKSLADIGIIQGITATSKKLKSALQKIYEDLEIKESYNKIKKAKATDLQNWFEIKKSTPKIKGKTTDCYTIIRSKIIFK